MPVIITNCSIESWYSNTESRSRPAICGYRTRAQQTVKIFSCHFWQTFMAKRWLSVCLKGSGVAVSSWSFPRTSWSTMMIISVGTHDRNHTASNADSPRENRVSKSKRSLSKKKSLVLWLCFCFHQEGQSESTDKRLDLWRINHMHSVLCLADWLIFAGALQPLKYFERQGGCH